MGSKSIDQAAGQTFQPTSPSMLGKKSGMRVPDRHCYQRKKNTDIPKGSEASQEGKQCKFESMDCDRKVQTKLGISEQVIGDHETGASLKDATEKSISRSVSLCKRTYVSLSQNTLVQPNILPSNLQTSRGSRSSSRTGLEQQNYFQVAAILLFPSSSSQPQHHQTTSTPKNILSPIQTAEQTSRFPILLSWKLGRSSSAPQKYVVRLISCVVCGLKNADADPSIK